MKRNLYISILILLILSFFSLLMLTSCSETPDEPIIDNPPSENPPIEDPPSENPPEETPPEDDPTEEKEIINIGMPIHKVVSRLGAATQSDLIPTVYYWDTGDDELLYVWFDNELRVKKFERRNNLNPDVGMTYSEVCDLLDSKGQKEAYAPNVYSFGLASDNKYLHVLFEQADDDNLIVTSYSYRPNITLGMSYDEISTHFNCAPERISFDHQIYYCNNDANEACVFEFEETDDALALSSFEYTEDIFIFSIIGKNYDEICEALGSTGELYEHEYAKSTIYRWDSNFDADLFVIFNDEMIAERFSYETDIETDVGSSYEMFKFVLDNPKYTSSYVISNKTPEELAQTNFTVVFETNSEFDMQVCINVGTKKIISIMYGVPRLDINNDMITRDIYAVLGEDYYKIFILGLGYRSCWHYGEYDLYAGFSSGRGLAWTLYFKECEGHEDTE